MSDTDFQEAKSHDPFFHEVAIFQQLIKERSSPFDLVRELLSNAAAKEVAAKNISIKYFLHPDDGHSFEVTDDGCGMDYTGNVRNPGRLDKFLNLGLSTIVGVGGDEFSWKGMGSKLAYQSRRVEIETCSTKGHSYKVEINAPWDTLRQQKRKPNPRVTRWVTNGGATGTTIRVFGHPPSRTSPIAFDDLYYYLKHRTFAGFTRAREGPPKIILKALNRQEEISVGFSILEYLEKPAVDGTVLVRDLCIRKTIPGTNRQVNVTLKGLYTFDRSQYGLADERLNNGLIVSVLGIPYFGLELRKYAFGKSLGVIPGPKNTCLIVECDELREELNISRSALTDSEITHAFEAALKEGLQEIGQSAEFKSFMRIPDSRKFSKDAVRLSERQQKLQSRDQLWVWLQGNDGRWIQIHRKPENETDTLAVLWKLEMMQLLPFAKFQSLEHSPEGADLICHIKEDKDDMEKLFTVVEAKYLFYGIDKLGHHPGQTQTVLCWDLGKEKRTGIEQAGQKPWKFYQKKDDKLIVVYLLSKMPHLKVATKSEIEAS